MEKLSKGEKARRRSRKLIRLERGWDETLREMNGLRINKGRFMYSLTCFAYYVCIYFQSLGMNAGLIIYLLKYADDVTLLSPENAILSSELKLQRNGMAVNTVKAKETIFRRPITHSFSHPIKLHTISKLLSE